MRRNRNKLFAFLWGLIALVGGTALAGVSPYIYVEGIIVSFDQQRVELRQKNGHIIRVPRKAVKADVQLRPGEKLAIFIERGTIR